MGGRNALISVIVPVYRTEAYLAACVESLKAQTFADWELILIDDGSPDSSGDLCDRFAAEDGRIKAVHQENGGVSRARNRGIREASADRIVFVDSDDTVEPEFLSRLWELYGGREGVLAACGFCEISEVPNYPCKPLPETETDPLSFLKYALSDNFGIRLSACACLFPKDRDLLFTEGQAYAEDSLFFCEALKKARAIAYDPAPLYKYDLAREGNTFRRRSLDKYLQSLGSWEKMAELFRGADPVLDSQFSRILTDVSLQASRQAAAEGDLREKKRLQKAAAARLKTLRNDPNVSSKDKLRLSLLQAAPVCGAALWEKIGGIKKHE